MCQKRPETHSSSAKEIFAGLFWHISCLLWHVSYFSTATCPKSPTHMSLLTCSMSLLICFASLLTSSRSILTYSMSLLKCCRSLWTCFMSLLTWFASRISQGKRDLYSRLFLRVQKPYRGCARRYLDKKYAGSLLYIEKRHSYTCLFHGPRTL